MTVCDFLCRIQEMMKRSGVYRLDPLAQVKIEDDVFDYFDISMKDNNLVIVPSDKWDRKLCKLRK